MTKEINIDGENKKEDEKNISIKGINKNTLRMIGDMNAFGVTMDKLNKLNNQIVAINDFDKKYQSIINIFHEISLVDTQIDYIELTKLLPYTRKALPETAVKHLKDAFDKERLCLVLGAGISSNYGIPTWNDLLNRLLVENIEKESEKAIKLSELFSKIFSPSPLIAGRYLESRFSEIKEKFMFEREVQKSLYQSFRKDYESKIVKEIIRMCIAPGKSPSLDSIITYNYDDIIERSLEGTNLDIPFDSIYGQFVDTDSDKLKIYHVHGFLPEKGPINEENKITLGEYVYHEQYSNMYSWNNIVQINKFRDKTCLFIGTSLTDPNVRRLLDIANSQKKGKNKKFHYIFKKKVDVHSLQESINKIIKEDSSLSENDFKSMDIKDIIKFLTEMKSRFEELDSYSLGVKTVWIDNYEEDIPKILHEIRQNISL
ncbi:MAG: SIR2 family protein [Flavobacteriaceae bacterium]|jgi:NAD-dependent SIR2 family protein deacetylase|nr:SIR2 family protein [Flavobacteriaceae bacterium]